MKFVDGENFTIQGQKHAQRAGLALKKGPYYQPDVFLWLPNIPATYAMTNKLTPMQVEPHAIRAFYYTSVVRNEEKLLRTRRSLHKLGFSPEVFMKPGKNKKAKGVDIALAKDFLGNAYSDNFDVALLIAGDGDYVPLVEETKRLGKIVYVLFFLEEGLGANQDLVLASDGAFDIAASFGEAWSKGILGEGGEGTT